MFYKLHGSLHPIYMYVFKALVSTTTTTAPFNHNNIYCYKKIENILVSRYDEGYDIDVIPVFRVKVWNMDNMI